MAVEPANAADLDFRGVISGCAALLIVTSTAQDLVENCEGLFQPGDVILVKGSRGVGLERLVQHLSSVYGEGGAE